MVDSTRLRPEINRRSGSVLALTLIVDEGAGIATRVVQELRAAIQYLDSFIQRADELRDCLECTLIAPPAFSLELQMSNIRCAVREFSELHTKYSLAETIKGIIAGPEGGAHRKYSAASEASRHWLVILSGGGNRDDVHWPPQMARKLEDESVTVIPILVGRESDPMLAAAFGPYRPPLQLDNGGGLRLSSWLGKELLRVARSHSGKRVFLDVGGMAAWAKI